LVVLPQDSRGFRAAHIRQTHVHHDDIRVLAKRKVDSMLRGFGFENDKPSDLQHIGFQDAIVSVVIDNKHSFAHHFPPPLD
jgi:hypothetical protein